MQAREQNRQSTLPTGMRGASTAFDGPSALFADGKDTLVSQVVEETRHRLEREKVERDERAGANCSAGRHLREKPIGKRNQQPGATGPVGQGQPRTSQPKVDHQGGAPPMGPWHTTAKSENTMKKLARQTPPLWEKWAKYKSPFRERVTTQSEANTYRSPTLEVVSPAEVKRVALETPINCDSGLMLLDRLKVALPEESLPT
eukprot:2558870-Pyramimonas_sp.AAC.1